MPIDKELSLKKDEYGQYYARYIRLSNQKPLKELLISNRTELMEMISGIEDEKALFRYEPEKWTLKQVIGHMIDTERIFQYRALAISRDEDRALPGYDHDQYVKQAGFNEMPFNNLKVQYDDTRNSTLSLFSGFTEEQLRKRGVVNGCLFTVRALGYVIAGHECHHLNTIRERYLSGILNRQ